LKKDNTKLHNKAYSVCGKKEYKIEDCNSKRKKLSTFSTKYVEVAKFSNNNYNSNYIFSTITMTISIVSIVSITKSNYNTGFVTLVLEHISIMIRLFLNPFNICNTESISSKPQVIKHL
jgi:hypothetical protein